MAEEEADPPRPATPAPSPSPHLEVLCKSSGTIRRFAVGTDAGFALSIINRKLDLDKTPIASYIEAFKANEEPINFGPNSVLANYGIGWKLQTVTELDYGARKGEGFRPTKTQVPYVTGPDGSVPTKRSRDPKPVVSLMYIWKILLAFILMFVLGAIFTLALDNLPQLILFIRSYM